MSRAAAPAGLPGEAPGGRQRAWRLARRIAPWLLAAVVLALLARQAHTIDWPQVLQALRAQPLGGLAAAAALALLSHGLFASYDLVSRHVLGHGLPRRHTWGIAAICYAFNINFGALVGALALKLRLSTRAGLEGGTVARVIGLSIVTNWLGYLAVGGAVLLLAPPPLPAPGVLSERLAGWVPGPAALQALGSALLALVAGWLLLCARRGGTALQWRSHALPLPRLPVALVQLGLASANWALMGAIVWLLLQQQLPYATVLGVLLLAAVAGVITHVPAGLGVLEAVFLACLGGQLPHPTLLAALLAYRATYYLLPLALAAPAYGWAEWRWRRGQRGGDAGARAPRQGHARAG